jgi:hypothetical protein
VSLQQEKGGARFRAIDLPVGDYGDFGNAVSSLPPDPPPSSIPSLVTFDVVWEGGGDTGSFHDTDFGFMGEFRTGSATIDFRARHVGSDVEYRSDPDEQSTAGPPGVGSEKNGVYFT